MSLLSKFNTGHLTSTDIEREFNDEFVSKAIVETAPRKRFYTNRGSSEEIPKHYGDTLTKLVRHPVINKDNMNDAGILANTANLLTNTFYTITPASYDAAGIYTGPVVTGEFEAVDYMNGGTNDLAAARGLAEAAANTAIGGGTVSENYTAGKLKTGAGRIQNGDASFAIAEGPLVELPEEGGTVNEINATTSLVSGKITFHGIAMPYTRRSQDLGSLVGEIGRKIKETAKAKKDIQEIQVMNAVLAQAELNSICASDVAVTKAGIGAEDVVDYDTLVAWEQSLLKDDVPLDTTILTGVNLTDTKVVEDAFIVDIPREAVPALRKLVGPGGVNVWVPKSKYAATAGTLIDGEVGMVEGLQFRFRVVPDLQKYQGAGLLAVATDDAYATAAGSADKATYDAAAALLHTSGTNIDVFPFVVVGDDSFVTTSVAGQNTQAKNVMPKADAYNDYYGEKGVISVKWSFGMVCYRPERLSMCLTALPRV